VQPQRIHDAPAPPPPPPTGGPNATTSTTGGTTSDVAARLTAIEGHLMAIARDSAQQTQAQKDIASRMAQLVEAINALKPA
jgi:hypothetical protein